MLAVLGLLEVKEAMSEGIGLAPIFLWQPMANKINQRKEVRLRPTASSLKPIANGKDQEVLTVGDEQTNGYAIAFKRSLPNPMWRQPVRVAE